MPPRAEERLKRERARHRVLLLRERALWKKGLVVAGLDEAGAGPLAGPVTAGCVVLDPGKVHHLVGVTDSKQLSPARRQEFAREIKRCALGFAVSHVRVETIDRINILEASLLAMKNAYQRVERQLGSIGHLLVDARRVNVCVPQEGIVKGDSKSLSIAAASVLAKEARDGYMRRKALEFPGYGFERHKGYGTREHLLALDRLGPTILHRRSFAPVRARLN